MTSIAHVRLFVISLLLFDLCFTYRLTNHVSFNGRVLTDEVVQSHPRSLSEKRDRIKGGVNAPQGRFPYMCNIRKIGSGIVVCGATLISERWVLTAAHCVEPGNANAANINPVVHCGTVDINNEDEEFSFVSEEIWVHEDWDGLTEHGHDIALLKLTRPCNFSKPILPRPNLEFFPGRSFAALGWGRTSSFGPYAPHLQLLDGLDFVANKNCNSELLWDGNVTNTMICAAGGNTDTCLGDSGGPLIVADRKNDKEIFEGSSEGDLLVGIVSFGQEPCGETPFPGVYTSVSHYTKWITDITEGKRNKDAEEEEEPSPVDQTPTDDTDTKKRASNTEKESSEKDSTSEEDRLIRIAKRRYKDSTSTEKLKIAKRVIQKDDNITLFALLDLGLDVDSLAVPSTKSSLLHWAAEYSAVDCVQVLIDQGADLDQKDSYKRTPIVDACLAGSIDVVKLLTRSGADLKVKNKNRQNLLNTGAMSNSPTLIHFLVRRRVKIEDKDKYRWTAVFAAASYGSPSVMKALLKYDPSVDLHDAYGYTPLHYAVSSRRILRDLYLTDSTVPDNHDDAFRNPYIPSNTNNGIVAKIYAFGSIFPERAHERWEANKPKNRDLDELLDAGAEVNARDLQRKTPLHASVCSNSTSIIRELVKRGAEVNATDEIWNTPLHEAALWSTPAIIKTLVRSGAHVNAKDLYGNTPLHVAAAYGIYNNAEALLENGADLTATNARGLSVSNATCTIFTCSRSDQTRFQTMLLVHGFRALSDALSEETD